MSNPFKSNYQAPHMGSRSFTEKLIVREDSQTGELGFVFANMPINEDLVMATADGALLAHDLTEHVNGPHNIGTGCDEFQAFGGIYYVRGYDRRMSAGNFGSAYTFEENVAAGITSILRDMAAIDQYDFYPEELPEYETDIDIEIDEVIAQARSDIPGDYNDEEELQEAIEAAGFDTLSQYLDQARKYMKMGYLKAEAMYDNEQYRANALYWSIAKAINTCSPECVGQEFTLTVNNDRVWFEEYIEDEPDYDEDEDHEESFAMEMN
jgi:hypothetical protein